MQLGGRHDGEAERIGQREPGGDGGDRASVGRGGALRERFRSLPRGPASPVGRCQDRGALGDARRGGHGKRHRRLLRHQCVYQRERRQSVKVAWFKRARSEFSELRGFSLDCEAQLVLLPTTHLLHSWANMSICSAPISKKNKIRSAST